MHIFKEGRRPFLEFLRNLTPQILLLSLAVVIGARLNFREIDLGNTTITVLFFALIALAFLGMLANSINFLVEYCRSLPTLEAAIKSGLGGPSKSMLHVFRVTVAESWKLRHSSGVEIAFAVIAIYAILLAVALGSVLQGASLLKSFK